MGQSVHFGNINYSKIMLLTNLTLMFVEQVHPENSEWTCFEQNASVDIKFFFGFESTIEKLAMKQYGDNIAKGKEIIEHFMDELRAEGITSVAMWTRPVGLPESPTGRYVT